MKRLKDKFYGAIIRYKHTQFEINELISYNGAGIYIRATETTKHISKGYSQFIDWTTLRIKLGEKSVKDMMEAT